MTMALQTPIEAPHSRNTTGTSEHLWNFVFRHRPARRLTISYLLLLGVITALCFLAWSDYYPALQQASFHVVLLAIVVCLIAMTSVTVSMLRLMSQTKRRGRLLKQFHYDVEHFQRTLHFGSWEARPGDPTIKVSEEVRHILGLSAETSLTSDILKSIVLHEDWPAVLKTAGMALRGQDIESSFRIQRDGRLRWVRCRAYPSVDASGALIKVHGLCEDITIERDSEDQLCFLGHHDPLTGLANRTLIQQRVDGFISTRGKSGSRLALIFLDIDEFKTINDALGHIAGDVVLRQVGERLQAAIRDSDMLARIGGDDFLLSMINIRDTAAIGVVINKIMERMLPPMAFGEIEHSLTFSIGVAVYPDDGQTFDSLLQKSEVAMYEAKKSGRNTWRFHENTMTQGCEQHLLIRTALDKALKRDEFDLHFQPQVCTLTGTVTGVEALLRWHHPEMGWINPDQFISIAESSGQIVRIGEWVIRQACRTAMHWRNLGLPPLRMAVNVSAIQFLYSNLEATISSALQESGMDARWLEVELTESTLIHNTESVLNTVRRLKALGIGFAIDDFGTGYSSLAYIKRFEVNKIKIDRSFVRELTWDINDKAIVMAIIQMAKTLQLKVIAEGVETEAQRSILEQNGCDEIQGYLIAQPMTSEQLILFLQHRQHRCSSAHHVPALRSVLAH